MCEYRLRLKGGFMCRIDLKEAKVGDKIRSLTKGWTKITEIDYWADYPIKYFCNGRHLSCTFDGKTYREDLYPEIVEWQPQKRKVKKEIVRWVNINNSQNFGYITDGKNYDSEREAVKYANITTIATTKVIIPFEVEE